MSKKRVTRSDVEHWIERWPDSEYTKQMIQRLENQERTSALRRKQLLEAIPPWYERPANYYAIKEIAWGDHPGVGYGAGQARAMLERLVKEGVVESTQAEGWNAGVNAYRYINDGETPEPPPPPPRDPEDDYVSMVKVRVLLEHFRYGLVAADPDEQQWHLVQIAKKLRIERYLEGLDYKPGTPPTGKDEMELPEGMLPLRDSDDPWFSEGERITVHDEHEVFPGEAGEILAVGRGTGMYSGQIVYDVLPEGAIEPERFTQDEIV